MLCNYVTWSNTTQNQTFRQLQPDNFLNSQKPPGLFESPFSRSGRWWSHILRLQNMLAWCKWMWVFKDLFFLYKNNAWFDHFRNNLGGLKSIPEREPFQPFYFGVRMHPCRPWWRFQSQSAISEIIETGVGSSGFSEMMLTMSHFRSFTSICFLSISMFVCYLYAFVFWCFILDVMPMSSPFLFHSMFSFDPSWT